MNQIAFYLLVISEFQFINGFKIDIFMPEVSPKKSDSYLCFKHYLNSTEPIYITEFVPKAEKNIIHHMLLFSCEEPVEENVWDCGEMNNKNDDDNSFIRAPVCLKQSRVLYAWAMDAPNLVLPANVSFIMGSEKSQYIVLQVHYPSVKKFKNGANDTSGVSLTAQKESLPKSAGIFYLVSGGSIKKNTTDRFEIACEMNEDLIMHPFAYRVHAHKLGIVNSGYKVSYNNESGKQEWTEIGRQSPQLPQMFYPIENKMTIKKGDIVTAMCTMNNWRDHDVFIGSTSEDEMCNFYVMYYVESKFGLNNDVCYTNGPPTWYFQDFVGVNGAKLDVEAIPDNASEAPNEVSEHNMDNTERFRSIN